MADYLDQFSSAEIAADYTLGDRERFLKGQGSKLGDFDLPQPQEQSSLLQLVRTNCASQYLALTEQYQHDELLLSYEQLDIYNQVLESFNSPSANRTTTCFFIEGKAGRGKSFTARWWLIDYIVRGILSWLLALLHWVLYNMSKDEQHILYLEFQLLR